MDVVIPLDKFIEALVGIKEAQEHVSGREGYERAWRALTHALILLCPTKVIES